MVSEKTRDVRTYERTNVRTDVTPKVSNDFVERPTKIIKSTDLNHKNVEFGEP